MTLDPKLITVRPVCVLCEKKKQFVFNNFFFIKFVFLKLWIDEGVVKSYILKIIL
jgi:hypothetical protein